MDERLTGADVLRALADGAELAGFEMRYETAEGWLPLEGDTPIEAMRSPSWTFRRKQLTRVVNGFTVPAPCSEAPPKGVRYFFPHPSATEWWVDGGQWAGNSADRRLLKRGLVFLDKHAATANAKAMCGTDPRGE